MPRYFLEVSYKGTAFHGSQLQGEQPTVQLAINKALSTILRTPIISFGASRTDEGVHALCNYYHFDIDAELNPGFIYNLNAVLPFEIAVKQILQPLDSEMNSRFAAIKRCYRYRIYNQKDPFLFERALYYPFRLDEDRLNEVAPIIKEYTNFESFSKRNTQTKTFECTIHESYWERQGKELHYVVEANRFLRGMVRGLVGTQLLAGRGKISVAEFRSIIEARDCSRADFSVEGFGLYLEYITYPPNSFKSI